MDFFTLISALQNPAIYPERPAKIQLIQTHVSAIFLADEYVYKVKKAVNFGFLDFTTLEKRKFYCHQEVALNRRLCPEVYLGVVEIRLAGGKIFLGEGPGEVVEYAVLMKKLPQDRMMDQMLARGLVTSDLLHKIAAKVANFHSQAATNEEIASYGGLATVQRNVEENFSQTEKYIGLSLPAEVFATIRDNTRRFLQAKLPLFHKRISSGKIRDCHGDLHLQHVCLTEEILIFDCIEFNERFRYADVAADIAFLLMDLDFHGYPLLAADLASSYLSLSRDWPLFLLLNFYKGYRAYVRGKVVSFRLDDPAIAAEEKEASLKEARSYFHLAQRYAQRMNRPALFITCGLIGTGKSTIAQAIGEALGWVRLSSDILRKELASLPPSEHRFEDFAQGIYAPDFSRQTYAALLERAKDNLSAGNSVILDASFKKQGDRREAMAVAQKAGADFLLLECKCPEECIARRLARRMADEKEVSDGRWEIFAEQKKDFAEVEEWSPDSHLPLNTSRPVEESLGTIFHYLLHREGRAITEAQGQ